MSVTWVRLKCLVSTVAHNVHAEAVYWSDGSFYVFVLNRHAVSVVVTQTTSLCWTAADLARPSSIPDALVIYLAVRKCKEIRYLRAALIPIFISVHLQLCGSERHRKQTKRQKRSLSPLYPLLLHWYPHPLSTNTVILINTLHTTAVIFPQFPVYDKDLTYQGRKAEMNVLFCRCE